MTTRSPSWYARAWSVGTPDRESPMILTIHLPDDVGQRLRERASRGGQAIENYVLRLIERDAGAIGPARTGDPSMIDGSSLQPGGGAALSDDESEMLLNELAAGPALPHLPAGFARADIYADHD